VLKEACVLVSHLSRTLCQTSSKGHNTLIDKFMEYFLQRDGLLKVIHSGKTALHELAHSCLKSIFTNLS
jgi:hypothetical protein